MENSALPYDKRFIKKPWQFWLVLFISWIISLAGIFFYGRTSVKCGECSPQITQSVGEPLGEKDVSLLQENCVRHNFLENEDQWNTKFYRKERDDFLCPKKGFVDPVMWYEGGLGVNFQKFSVEYKVRKDDKLKTNKPPSFIFACGRDYKEEDPIFKLWVPEGENLQLFRFAKNLNFDAKEATLSAEPAVTLSDPVKFGMTDTLTIIPTHKEGNDLFLNFTYSYTSSVTGKGEKDTIPKEIKKTPISNIPSSVKKLPIGVETYVGNCIGEISYEICY